MTSNRNPTRRYEPVDRRREAALRRLGPGPFTAEAAHAAGLTRSDLRSDAVTPVLRGTYVTGAHRITHELRCAAALMLAPAGSRVAGLSAARLWGLPVPEVARVTVCAPFGARVRSAELSSVRRCVDLDASVWCRDAGTRLLVTPLVALVAECIDVVDLVGAVVLADAVRARGAALMDHLPPGLANARQRAALRRVVTLSDGGAESVMESRARLLLALAGLRGMVSQHTVVEGGRTYRIDLAFPDLRVAIEYDGAHHFVSDEQGQADIQRAENLRAAGWIVIHLVAKDVYGDPAGTIERVARALRSRGADVNIVDEWRVHFPQRVAEAA